MSPDPQRLKDISAEFARGNIAAMERHLADDVRWNILGNGTVTGKDEVIEVSRMVQLQSFPRITIGNIVCEGNFVVIESTGEATTTSGKPYNQAYCEVFRFHDEAIQEITTYLDTALSARALS
jgi:hypothetical protein